MLRIQHPASCIKERKYIYKVIFEDFLGLPYTTSTHETEHTIIHLERKTLRIADTGFQAFEKAWLQPESLPDQPLHMWDSNLTRIDNVLCTQKLPIIYGDTTQSEFDWPHAINIDIFGSAFFMLSRYEEAIIHDRDRHNRFPATASLSFMEGFLERPIIDEYVELFWATLKTIWPGLTRKKRSPKTVVSCDVDLPYVWNAGSLYYALKQLGGD